MFDIGFAELLILSLVALLVLGPERLPEALRTLGRWIVRIRRTVGSLQAELEQEIGMDEIRRELHNNRILEEARALERELKDADHATRAELGALEQDLKANAMDPAATRRAEALAAAAAADREGLDPGELAEDDLPLPRPEGDPADAPGSRTDASGPARAPDEAAETPDPPSPVSSRNG